MFAPALSMLTAVWLLMTPYMELEDGPRAVAVVIVGLATLVLAPLSVWSQRAGSVMALLGVGLGMVNFVVPGAVSSMADLAACGVVLAQPGGQQAAGDPGDRRSFRREDGDRRLRRPAGHSGCLTHGPSSRASARAVTCASAGC